VLAGVGFYSAFLVSDHVQVVSRKEESSKPYVWESSGSGTFSVFEAPADDAFAANLTRGTEIRVHVKEGADEYLQESKIKDLVKTYSEFINFPIKLNDTVLNEAKALWLRDPKEVTEEEHSEFFQVLSKYPGSGLMAHSHFSAEGDVDFKAVLYIPSVLPPDFYDSFTSIKASLKLYVRRVFISDSLQDMVPNWLRFLVGVVDSDSLPLNVSREVLQATEGIKVIKKKIVRKAIDMIKKLASDEDPAKYDTFWGMYGKAIKMGIIEDQSNRRRLLPLLRFQTSLTTKTDGNATTLDEYVSRMKEDQTSIYYLVGSDGIDELKRSPFVEMLDAKGFEVIFFDEPLDEYVTAHVTEYEGKTLSNVSKDSLQDVDKPSKKASAYFKGMGAWWKKQVDDISSVRVSNRLASAPCVVVSGKYGWSATMEKIAKLQALADPSRATMMKNQRILEINPRHPLIQEIRKRWETDPEDADLVANSKLLYETCLLNSGFLLDEHLQSHSERIIQLLGTDLQVGDVSLMLDEIEYPDVKVEDDEIAKQPADAKDEEVNEPEVANDEEVNEPEVVEGQEVNVENEDIQEKDEL
jgi:heat shock protein beta